MTHVVGRSAAEGAEAEILDLTQSLLDPLIFFTRQGLAAVEAHDLAALSAAISRREQTLVELETHLARLPAGALQGERPGLSRLRAQMETLRGLESQLRVALGAEQQRVAVELELLDGEVAIRAAYGQKGRPPAGRTINIVR